MKLYYGVRLRNNLTVLNYRSILRSILGPCSTTLYNGIMLQNHFTKSYYAIISRNIMELYHELMFYGKDPGDTRGVNAVPWDLREPPKHAPGTAPRRPLDPLAPSGTVQTAVSQHLQRQKLSLHCCI